MEVTEYDVRIAEYAFADDTILMGRQANELQIDVNKWPTTLKECNMRIKVTTKFMSIRNTNEQVSLLIEQINEIIFNTAKLYYALCKYVCEQK